MTVLTRRRLTTHRRGGTTGDAPGGDASGARSDPPPNPSDPPTVSFQDIDHLHAGTPRRNDGDSSSHFSASCAVCFGRGHNPSGQSRVSFTLWSSCGFERAAEPAIRRAIGYLEAWRDDRAVDLQRTGADWFTLDVLSGRLRTTLLDEVSEQDWTGKYAVRLRDAARRCGLVGAGAADRDVAIAVQDWLVLNQARGILEARRTTVLDATRMLSMAVAGTPSPRTPTLELDADARHIKLNGVRLTYRRSETGKSREMTIAHGAIRSLVQVVVHGRLDSNHKMVEDASGALRGAAGGPYVVSIGRGGSVSITPPIAISTSLQRAVETRRRGR